MTVTRLGMVLALALAQHTLGQEGSPSLSPEEQRLIEAMESYADYAMSVIESEAEKTKRTRPRDRNRIRQLESLAKRFQSTPYVLPKLLPWRLKTGDIGLLFGSISGDGDNEQNRFRVVQVVDSQNMIVESYGKGHTIDEAANAIRRQEKLLWITGVDTSGVTDDTYIKLDQIFEVKGTKRYETAFGTNTVFLLSPYPIQDTSAVIAKARSLSNYTPRESPKREESGFRVWRDASGVHSIEAQLVKAIGGTVTLMKRDGTEIEIEASKLSDRDRAWLKDRGRSTTPD